MKCRTLAMAFTGLALAASSGAQGQTADLTQARCAQFSGLQGAEQNQLALWLHGYYSGAAQRPLLDRNQLEEAVGAMRDACVKNPELPLLGIEARAILRGEPLPEGFTGSGQRPATGEAAPAPSGTPTAQPSPRPSVPTPVR